MKKPLFAAFVPAALSLFIASAAMAQAMIEKPRNRIALPMTVPVVVDIRMPQKEIESKPAEAYGGALPGTIAGEISSAIARSREEKYVDPLLRRLRSEMPTRDYATILEAALRSELESAGLVRIQRIDRIGTGPGNASAADPEAQAFAISGSYYMTSFMRDLRVELYVRYGKRSTLASPNRDRAGPEFSQRLFYDMPATGIGYFSGPAGMAEAWESLTGDQAADHVERGFRELAKMLAYELQRKPRFGRIPGKQYEWRDGQYATYGATEIREGDRAWLRMRSGALVSVPLAAAE